MANYTAYRERRPAQRRLQTQRRLCSVKEVAAWLGCKEGSLRDNRFRAKHGLAAIRVGNRLMFSPDDIEAYIERRRETLPLMPSRYDNDEA
jgi:hypothetical protein